MAADAGFYSAKNEAGAQAMGVEQVAIPNRSTKSAERKRHQKKRWFRKAQKWRTGSEGRISLLKRTYGLDRCFYKGDDGMKWWVGLGVIADNLINIGRKLADFASPAWPLSIAPFGPTWVPKVYPIRPGNGFCRPGGSGAWRRPQGGAV